MMLQLKNTHQSRRQSCCRRVLLICSVVCFMPLAACVDTRPNLTSLPIDGPAVTQEIKRLTAESEDTNNENKLLALQEMGRLKQLMGDPVGSNRAFLAAGELYAQQDEVIIGSGRVVDFLQSTLSNDKAVAYAGTSAERVFVHGFQIVNHLQTGNLDRAFVAARRSIEEQDELRRTHEKLTNEAQKALRASQDNNNNGQDYTGVKTALASNASVSLRSIGGIAPGQLSSDFQNPWAYIMSAMVLALDKNANALAMSKRGLELLPENLDLGHLTRWIGASLKQSDPEERKSLEALYPSLYPSLNPSLDGDEPIARLAIILEHGYAQPKQEHRFTFHVPTTDSRGRQAAVPVSIALPYYPKSRPVFKPVTIQLHDEDHQLLIKRKTSLLVDVNTLNQADLSRDYALIFTRMVTRVVTKAVLRGALQESGGQVAGLMGSIYNMVSERADLRSWTTLPSNIQFAFIEIPVGRVKLELDLRGQVEARTLDLQPGLNIIRALGTANTVRIDQIWPVTASTPDALAKASS